MQKALGLAGAVLAATTLLAVAQPAHAIGVIVSEGLTNGQQIDSSTNPVFSGTNTASATFTYNGPLNFSNTAPPVTTASGDLNSTFFDGNAVGISGYSGSGTVTTTGGTQVANYATLASFLASSGSSAPLQYASYYQFDLGVLAAGTTLTITHDDGASVYQGTTRVGNSVTGATGAVTDRVLITNTADTVIRYTRQNSTPSILQVAVPEPMSLGLLGAGLAGIGLIRRRKRFA